jgi:hypothetical protein
MENDMTTEQKLARMKLSLLDLAKELPNVSRACKVMGYSLWQFYEIRRNLQTYGADGLIDRLKDQHLEHQHRIKGRPPAFRSIKPLQRLIEQRPEPLEITHRRHGLQRIAQIAHPLQPLNNVKNPCCLIPQRNHKLPENPRGFCMAPIGLKSVEALQEVLCALDSAAGRL